MNFDKDFDNNFNRVQKMQKWFMIAWGFAFAMGLGMMGVLIWALIKMVTKFAG